MEDDQSNSDESEVTVPQCNLVMDTVLSVLGKFPEIGSVTSLVLVPASLISLIGCFVDFQVYARNSHATCYHSADKLFIVLGQSDTSLKISNSRLVLEKLPNLSQLIVIADS